MGPDGPKWAQEDFFPTNPDLADILGRTDFDFENFYSCDFLGSQVSGLGPAWAHPLGPHVGPPTLGPTWAHPLGPHVGHPLGPRVGPPTWAPRVDGLPNNLSGTCIIARSRHHSASVLPK